MHPLIYTPNGLLFRFSVEIDLGKCTQIGWTICSKYSIGEESIWRIACVGSVHLSLSRCGISYNKMSCLLNIFSRTMKFHVRNFIHGNFDHIATYLNWRATILRSYFHRETKADIREWQNETLDYSFESNVKIRIFLKFLIRSFVQCIKCYVDMYMWYI